MVRQELSAVTKAYDFVLWLLPHVAGFARTHRFTLGDRIEEGALDLLELLVEASYTSEKRGLLRQANLRLSRLRYLVRLAKDLHLLTIRQYAFAAGSMESIGGEIGGWLKQQAAREARA